VKIVGALLAAGASQRMGEPKQLLDLDGDGCLVRCTAQVMSAAALSRLGVVVDPGAPAVAEALRGLEHDLLASEDPGEGIAASIRAAVAWATASQAEALLLCVCDQPLLTSGHLDRLLETCQEEDALAASYYEGMPAVPAVFPARYFKELAELHGDVGAAKLLRKARELSLVAWPEGAHDLDRPDDVAAWRARSSGA
jgi:molybdenum cofactor cytidylyltransferase